MELLRRFLPHSGRFLRLPLVLLHRLLIVRQCLPLHKRNRIRRTDRQAVAKPVAVVIADQLRLSVDHCNRTLMTGMRTEPASRTFFFLYLNNFSNHDGISFFFLFLNHDTILYSFFDSSFF